MRIQCSSTLLTQPWTMWAAQRCLFIFLKTLQQVDNFSPVLNVNTEKRPSLFKLHKNTKNKKVGIREKSVLCEYLHLVSTQFIVFLIFTRVNITVYQCERMFYILQLEKRFWCNALIIATHETQAHAHISMKDDDHAVSSAHRFRS